MAPVEGEKSFGGRVISEISPINPGTHKRLFTLYPTIISVRCPHRDDKGSANTIDRDPQTKMFLEDGEERTEIKDGAVVNFSGQQRLVIEKTVRGTEDKEEIVLWHRKRDQDPIRPPLQSASVPVSPEKNVLVPNQIRSLALTHRK